ncbi:hypothetical protein QBC41DRAFT_366023 [Cercophora samala]|uniref:Uncharacterized protein n=1 Tax=Cercophora samala TaxID=330535 RepID=A0AA39ZB82_9PEZI|nr:hypothetical protein QBC41DRAFT_366023 [Cercophora samala]
MARSKNNNQKGRKNAAQNGESSAQAAKRAAQLELPEGYQRPGSNADSNGSGCPKGKGNRTKEARSAKGSKVMLASSYPKPWEMTKLYGAPIKMDGTLNFNYDRPWMSFEGKDAKKELATALEKGRREMLPPVFPDYSPEQKEEVRQKYERIGMLNLFEARDSCNRNPPVIRGFMGGINPAMTSAEHTTQVGANTESPLINFLAQIDLCKGLVSLLHPSVRDITALAFTCKQAGPYVDRIMEVWNFSAGQYFSEAFLPSVDSEGKQTRGSGGIRNDILVITTTSPKAPTQTPYEEDLYRTLNLVDAMVTIPQSFRHLALDRIPLLDPKMVDLVISSMPNLETLSISRCDLLDISQLPALIDIIKRHPRTLRNKDKGKAICASNHPESANTEGDNNGNGNAVVNSSSVNEQDQPSNNDTSLLTDSDTSQVSAETTATSVDEDDGPVHYIRLDFSPFFFRGPNTCQRIGSYGVTYNEPTFHTPKAVVGLIMRCFPDAMVIGMDLMSDSSSFFSFVRRLPGWDCLWALKARDAMLSYKRDVSNIVLPQDFLQTVERTARSEIIAENEGRARLAQTAFQDRVTARVERLRQDKHDEMKTAIQHRFYDDLMAATSGDDFRPTDHPIPALMAGSVLKSHNDFGYWRNQVRCQGCKKLFPRVLFAVMLDLCWGCKMINFIREMESSHLRRWKRSAIEHLLEGLDTKKGSLTDVMDPARGQQMRLALQAIKTADHIWLKFVNFSPSAPVVYPPEPENLDTYSAAYSRYRWKQNWPKQAFDYREGGPQHEDPFRYYITDYDDRELCGGEPPESFNAKFKWSEKASQYLFERYIQYNQRAKKIEDPEAQRLIEAAKRWEKMRRIPGYKPKDRDEEEMWHRGQTIMRRDQNLRDNSVHVMIHGRVELQISSLHTPMLRPFNLDYPFPDKRVNDKAYREFWERHRLYVNPPGHSRQYL